MVGRFRGLWWRLRGIGSRPIFLHRLSTTNILCHSYHSRSSHRQRCSTSQQGYTANGSARCHTPSLHRRVPEPAASLHGIPLSIRTYSAGQICGTNQINRLYPSKLISSHPSFPSWHTHTVRCFGIRTTSPPAKLCPRRLDDQDADRDGSTPSFPSPRRHVF